MFARPINNILKKHFQTLFTAATEKAEKDFASNTESKLKDLDHFNQLKFLAEESDRLEELVEKNQYPFYTTNHSSEHWLLEQFASRTFVLGTDESEELSNCIYLGKCKRLVDERKWKLQEEVPPYTFAEFLSGKVDPYFAEFDRSYGVNKEDYYQIRIWQAQNLIKVISYESRMLIKKMQEHCKTLANPLAFLISEKEKIESSLQEAKGDAEKIKAVLAELYIFSKEDLPEYDNEMIVECFDFYLSEKIHWKYAFPFYLDPLLEKINQKTNTVFSRETTIFFTINKIEEWIETVIAGQPLQQKIIETEWEKLFKQLKKSAEKQAEELKEELNVFVENPNLSKEEVKDYLNDKFEIYSNKFNEFESKNFFITLGLEEENILQGEILKKVFMTESFFGNRIEEETKNITEAIIIRDMLWEIVHTYMYIFDTHKMDLPVLNAGQLEIMDLMNQMVLDKELHDEMREGMDDFFRYLDYSLPIELHFHNHKKKLAKLFHKSLGRLQGHLDEAEPTKKILYLQSRLKELRHREVQVQELIKSKDFSIREFQYDKLFKDFLEIEADFIRETKDIILPPALPEGKINLVLTETNHTFDTLLSEPKATFILKMLEDLGITVNGAPKLGGRKKGALRGVVEAALEKNILPPRSIHSHCVLIANKIGLELKAKLADSHNSGEMRKKAVRYISEKYNP